MSIKTVLSMLVSLVAGSSLAQINNEYNLRYIGDLSDSGSQGVATGVNDVNRAVGSATVNGLEQPFWWEVTLAQSKPTALPLPTLRTAGGALSINGAHDAVGWVFGSGSGQQAAKWSWNSQANTYSVQVLNALAPAAATSIGDTGAICGWFTNVGSLKRAFVQRFLAPVELPLPAPGPGVVFSQASSTSVANKVGDLLDGRLIVVGAVTDTNGVRHAVFWLNEIGSPDSWTATVMKVYPSFPPDFGADAQAVGATEDGKVVGQFVRDPLLGNIGGFVWNPGMGTLGTPNGQQATRLGPTVQGQTYELAPNDVNRSGRVVGRESLSGLTKPFWLDLASPNTTTPLVSGTEADFGYVSGQMVEALSVNNLERQNVAPTVTVRGRRTADGKYQAVLARALRRPGGQTGRAIGGVSVTQQTVYPNTPIGGQISTNYESSQNPVPDFQAERGTTGETVIGKILLSPAVGGQSEVPNLQFNRDSFQSDPFTLQTTPADAGKLIQLTPLVPGFVSQQQIQTVQISKFTTSVELADPPPVNIGAQATFAATVLRWDDESGSVRSPLNSVPVEFKVVVTGQGDRVLGVSQTNNSGVATWTGLIPTDLTPGSHQLVATFAATSQHEQAQDTKPLSVSAASVVQVAGASVYPGQRIWLLGFLGRDCGPAGCPPVPGQTLAFYKGFGSNGQLLGQAVTDSNGLAAIPYLVPPDTAIGTRFPITAVFAGTQGVPAAQGTGWLEVVASSSLRDIPNFVLGATEAVRYEVRNGQNTLLFNLEGTFGEPFAAEPGFSTGTTRSAYHAFWHSVVHRILTGGFGTGNGGGAIGK